MGTHVQRYDGQINFMGKIKKKKKKLWVEPV